MIVMCWQCFAKSCVEQRLALQKAAEPVCAQASAAEVVAPLVRQFLTGVRLVLGFCFVTARECSL
jgi:hypothetical protein